MWQRLISGVIEQSVLTKKVKSEVKNRVVRQDYGHKETQLAKVVMLLADENQLQFYKTEWTKKICIFEISLLSMVSVNKIVNFKQCVRQRVSFVT